MSYEQPDTLHFEGHDYGTASYPLASFYCNANITPPFNPIWPTLARGYRATWRVECGQLYLVEIEGAVDGGADSPTHLLNWMFPAAEAQVLADWYTGTIHCYRGRKRHLGSPSSIVFDDEAHFHVIAGVVQSIDTIDNSTLPDPTDDEIRQSLPRFLWPARLRRTDR